MINAQEPPSKAADPTPWSQDVSPGREGVNSLSDALRDGLRLQREQAKMAARKASRVTYDLSPDLRESLRILSEELCIPASQLAALALIRFLQEFKSCALDLSSYKKTSRSPRYDWSLELPENPMKKKRKVKLLKSLK